MILRVLLAIHTGTISYFKIVSHVVINCYIDLSDCKYLLGLEQFQTI